MYKASEASRCIKDVTGASRNIQDTPAGYRTLQQAV
jgi:hypothetical protein